MGDEGTAVFWGRDRFYVLCYQGESEEDLHVVVHSADSVIQEDYAAGTPEALMVVFTSPELARNHLKNFNWTPEALPRLKIYSMDAEALMPIVGAAAVKRRIQGGYLRVDVIGVDNGVQKREILYSKLISSN